ncbi:DUF1800 domain-containing protein [Neolewinella agarilytica]|uniref:DUF1800 domain-containing protein n=1 Tax=Neolewinella agarilytica TaxID=478744 RepID=UPI002353D6EC|nr:DUF1800 family protein [Neolewinella agarilytica]
MNSDSLKLVGDPLEPYSGSWGESEAAYLLRRAMYGPKLSEIHEAVRDGLSATIDRLFEPRPVPAPPVNYVFTGDPTIPVGTTWVDKPYRVQDDENYRIQSLNAWYIHNKLSDTVNIQEKLNLFWVNHFGMSGVIDHRAQYKTIELFYTYGSGHFGTLLEQITVDPGMLQFLDGEVNHRNNPNENYARELLELYTIQKGVQIGGGDYSNYTEQDVAAAARILTGWRNYDFVFSDNDTPVDSYFDSSYHDEGEKIMSYHFGNRVISNQGEEEYRVLISLVLEQEETAYAISRELYRYFVYSEIPEEVEQTVIACMANRLLSNGYNIGTILKELLGSQHFFDLSFRGAMIKNPYEFVLGVVRPLGGYDHLNLTTNIYYQMGSQLSNLISTMNMSFLFSPTVSGWRAYYDSPGYTRNWVSPVLLQRRREFSDGVTSPHFHTNNYLLPLDLIGFFSSLETPGDVNNLIDQLILLFLPKRPSPFRVSILQEQILEGLPAFTWLELYADFISNPNDEEISNLIERRVRRLLQAIFNMAEFQLQ